MDWDWDWVMGGWEPLDVAMQLLCLALAAEISLG